LGFLPISVLFPCSTGNQTQNLAHAFYSLSFSHFKSDYL
jgi:hypothetical protein